jgi:hypothetical protein
MPFLSGLKPKGASNALRDMRRGIAAHACFKMVNVCPREACGLRKLALRHAALLSKFAYQLCKGRGTAYSHFTLIPIFQFIIL